MLGRRIKESKNWTKRLYSYTENVKDRYNNDANILQLVLVEIYYQVLYMYLKFSQGKSL